jgi:hypothetical protein
MTIHRHVFSLGALTSLSVAAGFASGCGGWDGGLDAGLASSGDNGQSFNTPGGGTVLGADGGIVYLPRCIVATNQCVATCSGGTSTSISGTVYDPAGKNPLYGIVVYVPSVPPGPLPQGAGCYSCSDLYQSGNPIAYAVTDASGKFTLDGVPDGANIPLVVQVGKWRMQYTVPSVAKCQDNAGAAAAAVTAAPNVLRLPGNHMEGDIPNIAIATGAADSLECLLHRIGVSEAEYGPGPSGGGRIHIFHGEQGANGGADTNPAAPLSYDGLWPNDTGTALADMMPYDITLLTCEGHETAGSGGGGNAPVAGGQGGVGNPPGLSTMQQQALFNYAAAGGRVFASHFHYAWFNTGPFSTENLARWTAGTNDMGNINAVVQTTLPGGGAFPRGAAMQQWLTNVGALTNGELPIVEARHNADVTAANTPTIPWILADARARPANATEYLSFDTPFGTPAGEQCGRVVYSDLHVGAASGDYGPQTQQGLIAPGGIVPSGCANNALSPQEKALEFMLFDLSGCITPPDQPPGGVPAIPTK